MISKSLSRLLFLVLSAFAVAAEPGVNLRSRQQFAQAMDKIKRGMSAAEVRAILGPPDDIKDDHAEARVMCRKASIATKSADFGGSVFKGAVFKGSGC